MPQTFRPTNRADRVECLQAQRRLAVCANGLANVETLLLESMTILTQHGYDTTNLESLFEPIQSARQRLEREAAALGRKLAA